jgi:uncharacterized damage-inducible protein DinB
MTNPTTPTSIDRGRTAIETLAWLSQQAFDGDPAHSLLANLRDLSAEEYTALPPGAGRTVADILEHVGWAKWMYQDYAFGSGSRQGNQPPMVPANGARSRPPAELRAWLVEGQQRWVDSVQGLREDAELEVKRQTNWGERLTTRALIRILIGHDYYHAGEINHIRALLRKTDTWAYE